MYPQDKMADSTAQVHKITIPVTAEDLDENGHVNNVVFVKWMQDIAVEHATRVGCTAATEEAGASWYVRSHHIDYKRPAFEGDRIVIETQVGDLSTARSTRTYKFSRETDGAVLALASTDWVFVDAATGRPRPIPAIMAELFGLTTSNE